MRQGQQHRRGRTRGGQNNNQGANNNNNNRKGQNPISRTYQSNGPDGKVSGTASGIAEKYLSLARDATTSGDPVLAENYLQHAEHYNRIILAYRESQAQGGEDGGPRRVNAAGESMDNSDEHGEDEGESFGRDMQPLPPVDLPPRPNDQQPRFENPRPDNNPRFEDRQPRFNDQQRRNNQPRDRYQGGQGGQGGGERFNNGDRGNDRFNNPRGDRFGNDRNQGGGQQFADRQPREGGFDRPPREGGADRQGGDRPFRDNNQPRVDRSNDHNRPDRPDRQDRFESRSEFRQEFRPQNRPPAAPELRSNEQPDIRPEPVRTHEPRAEIPVREPVRVEQPPFVADLPLGVGHPPLPRPDAAPRAPRAPRRERAPTVVAEHEQPEFLRRPVRRPRREAASSEEAAAPPATPASPPDREPGQD